MVYIILKRYPYIINNIRPRTTKNWHKHRPIIITSNIW